MAPGAGSMEFPRRQIRPRDRNRHQNLHPLMKVNQNLHHMEIHKGVRPIGQWHQFTAIKGATRISASRLN
jgi:hypothetical protein